jgi:hypothetical protein
MSLFHADALTFTNQAVSQSTAQAVTEDGGAGVGSGRLLGVRATISDNTGDTGDTVTVKVYKSSALTVAAGGEELYSADFSFGSDAETLSDLLASPIPFFAQPHVTITPASQADTDMVVTLYIDDGR